jgi:hypothetical protein
MAEGTRLKGLDDGFKALQDSHKQMQASQDQLHLDQKEVRADVNLIATSMEDQKKTMNKLLVQLSQLMPKHKHRDDGPSDDILTGGFSVIGRHKPAPVNLPRFAGTHPERWVAQAGRYFNFYSIVENDRLTIASFYLDDEAADWFDWMSRNDRFVDWSNFTAALIQRFRAKDLESPEGLLAKLTQTSTVADYRHQFEEISNRSMVLPSPFLISCFISGLRADIKQSVLIHRPVTLEDAMETAQLHENRIQLEKGLGRVHLGNTKPILPTPKTPIQPTTHPPLIAPSANSKPLSNVVGFRRLTPTELAQK